MMTISIHDLARVTGGGGHPAKQLRERQPAAQQDAGAQAGGQDWMTFFNNILSIFQNGVPQIAQGIQSILAQFQPQQAQQGQQAQPTQEA